MIIEELTSLTIGEEWIYNSEASKIKENIK